ncbi:hypothetical protein tb265_21560 [Gemmatimonadetes bacterium T265]|nr:hypothetical protein tb265_21560 [Gemmatimonadetes bacterium T265]
MSDTSFPLVVSVLDQSPIPEGTTPSEALHASVALARDADALGYHRFWVAEHHGTPGLAGASPEILIAAIASATSRIRVGSGGVMLPHYSPLKVAETFSALAGLFPGRIDLGLGRAAGTDPGTAYALQRDRRASSPDDFPQQLVELLGYLDGTLPAEHGFSHLAATLPGLPEVPVPWLLGSSPQSGIWAAELGLPYAFADFINPHGAEIARRYRDTFTPAPGRERPHVAVCVWALCAETDAEAERLALSGRMMFTLLRRGELIPVPTVERAERYLAAERARSALPVGRRTVVGSPETVRAGIEDVARAYAAAEVLVVTIAHDVEARRRSYALLADAFGLAAGGPREDALGVAAVSAGA